MSLSSRGGQAASAAVASIGRLGRSHQSTLNGAGVGTMTFNSHGWIQRLESDLNPLVMTDLGGWFHRIGTV